MNPSFLLALRRRLLLVLLVPLVVGLLVFATTPAQDDEVLWMATETITYEPNSTNVTDSQSRVAQAALLIRQPTVARLAAEEYGGTDEGLGTFASRIETEVDRDALTIKLSAEGEDPEEIERYVHSFATGFVQATILRTNESMAGRVIAIDAETNRAQEAYDKYTKENAQQLRENDPAALAQRQRLFAELDSLQEELRDASRDMEFATSQYAAVGITPAEEAEPETMGFLGNGIVRGLMAGLLALLGMVGLVALLDRLAPRVSDRDHVEEIAGVPVLTMVPQVRARRQNLDRLDPEHFAGPLAEAYRTLRVHLQFLAQPSGNGNGNGSSGAANPPVLGAPPPTTTVAIVSAAPGEGKTTTAALLAMSFAEVETDTLVLGCDFRRPSIHERFGTRRSPGFTDRRGAHPVPALTELIHRDPITGVRVLPSGHATSRFHDLTDIQAVIQAGRAGQQQIVIDTAPILVASETAEIAAMTDHVVLVVRAGRTSVRALREAVTTMQLNHINLIGVVLVGALEASDYAYYYTQYRTERGSRRDTPSEASTDHATVARP